MQEVITLYHLRRPDGSVGMALVLPALTDCRWWLESLLVHSGVSSATRRKATGADHRKDNIVSSRHGMAAETRKNIQTTRTYQRVSEATKAPCGNKGSLQPGSPRSHGTGRQGITTHIVTSKQTTATPCRNESGEKTGETNGET